MALRVRDARPAAEVAAEVLGLGQRPFRSGRRDLDRVVGEQVAERFGDPLAEREVDAVRVVDDQPQRVAAGTLEHDQLHLGVEMVQAVFDCRASSSGMVFSSLQSGSWRKKRWARAHLSSGFGY